MLKLWCDFNTADAGTDPGHYLLLRVPDGSDRPWPELYERAESLGIKAGDRVILFQDVGDFEVEATLEFGPVSVLAESAWYAIPDWDTLKRFDQAGR